MSIAEPAWISVALALAIHERQIAEHGGQPGIRDRALLESAMARPRQRFSFAGDAADLPELAAAYAFGVARNHPFIDGSKRTAYVVLRTFVLLNGWDLVVSQHQRYQVMVDLASGALAEDNLAEWLRTVMRPNSVSEGGLRYE